MRTDLLLKNITIIDIECEKLLKGRDILIKEDKIADIIPWVPDFYPEMKMLDCSGKYALPGLFECHAHMAHLLNIPEREKILKSFVDQGITQVRDVGGSLSIVKKLKESISKGEVTGPDIFYSGPMLEKSPLHWEQVNKSIPEFTVAVDSVSDADRIISELHDNGVSHIKTFNKFNPDVFSHLCKKAKSLSLPVTHDPGMPLFHRIPMDMAIYSGATCIEHGKSPYPIVLKPELQEEHDRLLQPNSAPEDFPRFAMKVLGLGVEAVSMERLNAIANIMLEYDVYFCPTLLAFASVDTEYSIEEKRVIKTLNEISLFFTQEFIKQDIKILTGVDSCMPELFNEMDLLRKQGLSNMKIIKGAVQYPAQWLNIYDRYGSIDINKKANILILHDNPVTDIGNILKICHVVKDGDIVFSAD